MKRRDFLAASAAAAAVGISRHTLGAEKITSAKEYLELRRYEFASAEKREAFEGFLGKAFIPALNRQGIRPVGAFKNADDKEDFGLWVLIPHKTLESVITCNTKILADPVFVAAGGDIFNCPMNNPAYTRFESSLLLAFDECCKVEVPSTKEGRIFQLRIYESHNTMKAKRKIEMFNAGGEIELFRLMGLNPVFFGESIIGSKMPNLTYMVGFDDADAQKKAWDAFIKHPKWKEMSSDPYYADTVSNITNLVLRPSGSSQI